MEPEAINELFSGMTSMIRDLSTGKGGPPKGEEPPAAPAAPTDEVIRKMFDPNDPSYDPIEATKATVARQYGGLVTSLTGNALENAYSQLRGEFPDFKDHETDVRKTLEKIPVAAQSGQLLLNTFFAVKGQKQSAKEADERRKAAAPRTQPPSPAAGAAAEAEINLEPGEETAARRLFPREADPIKKYKEWLGKINRGETSVKVPVGRGKKI